MATAEDSFQSDGVCVATAARCLRATARAVFTETERKPPDEQSARVSEEFLPADLLCEPSDGHVDAPADGSVSGAEDFCRAEGVVKLTGCWGSSTD